MADPSCRGQIKQLQDEIGHLLEMEDIQWKQIAKRNWYRQGDRNTKFFHSWASHQRKINHIESIVDVVGNRWTEPKDVDRVFLEYFLKLYSTASPSGIENSLIGVHTWVTDQMNDQLRAV